MNAFHACDLDVDEDGWWFAACACGWISYPCPDRDVAVDAYGDHRGDE